MAATKSPFFKPSAVSGHTRAAEYVIVQQRTPGGRTKVTQQQQQSKDDGSVGELKAGLLGTSSNLVNAIVGCGIVGIPFAVQRAGFVAGIFLIVFVAIVTEKSLRLLVNTAKHVHVGSYETLAEAAFGVFGFRFIAINMFIVAFGAMVSYLLIIKESFGTLVFGDDESLIAAGQDPALLKRAVLVLISLVIALPLACKRDMADLAQTSKLNVFIDTTLVALVACNAPFMQTPAPIVEADGTVHEHHYNMWIHMDTIFVGLGVLSFAFVCQHSAFIIAGSLDNPTTSRWGKVTSGSLALCCMLALICGITGYLGYRENTKGNILENLDSNSMSANIARALLSTTMLFVYPLESFVTRHVLVVLLFSGRAAHEGDDSAILSRRDRRVGLTTALYILAVIPAALANDLGSVLAFTGAVGGSCLSYIGPGVVYLAVHGERFLQLTQQAWRGDNPTDTKTTMEEGVMVIAPATDDRPAVAVETTPLVAGGAVYTRNESADADDLPPFDEKFVVKGFWNNLTWYGLGMPFWCAIAKVGKARLQDHVHDLALKSPHPIRIGDVEYSRMLVKMSGKEDIGVRLKQLYREASLSASCNSLTQAELAHSIPVGVSGHGSERNNINQQIGRGLLEQQKKNKVKKGLEEDPQEAPPTWLDYYIAVCYILLGFVALFAGIGSIFMESN